MKRKRIPYEEDDGETVANMNVEGMPWYREKSQSTDAQGKPQISLHSAEGRAAVRGALLAAMLVVAIFVGGAFLFILFLQKVWLK